MIEIWKDIIGYEGRYQVSNFGRIKSLGNNKTRKEKFLKLTTDKDGYLSINLSCKGKIKKYQVHRIECQMFIPNIRNKPEVNHKDGVKSNNYIENLEWNTYSENLHHAYKNKLRTSIKGERNNRVKLTQSQVDEIREKYKTGNYLLVTLSKEYKVSISQISKIVKHKAWI